MLSPRREWDAVGALIGAKTLDAFPVVGPADKLAAALRRRCDGGIDCVLPIFPQTASTATVIGRTGSVASVRSCR
jgi:hypothetical protein